MYMSSSTVLGLGAIWAGVAQAQTVYGLHRTYDAGNFWDEFDFFNEPDPTRGFVEYVDNATAMAEGLAASRDGQIFMGVDTVTEFPANGRKSVRVTSRESFTHGLFIADLAHVPSSACGSWPALWSFGPNWPASGEIDILEGVNTQHTNSITLHTSPGCSISQIDTVSSTTLANADCNTGTAFTGCSQHTADNQNYGDGMNAIGGGVYAMEWLSEHIAVWYFPRYAIPQDILRGDPVPSTWGLATAKFYGGSTCDLDAHFMNHNLVFDTTFCGDWAGAVWADNPECSALAPTCNEYVAANPGAFVDSFWSVNSINVYKLLQ
ncbi:glycoside hydrolase family 16 protein [Stachybotrys elegans]|uniref:endo-1,3(4)-beta-glucanase n=1 Tax=Stachybotrys elegans TaxID=80388 RepID=A0A8K0T8Q8_9HYPO|nr:glycoside hydrolase family 16 protein [Stachybotrys elegans]